MTSSVVGNFKLSKSENFDEFLKELGVGMIKRKVIIIPSLKCNFHSIDPELMKRSPSLPIQHHQRLKSNRMATLTL